MTDVDLLRTRADLTRLEPLRAAAAPLVLVPTMGALHAGHLALVRRARELGDPVVSIFVNPTQFAAGEDFAAYPRDLERDLALLEPLGVAAVFAPAVDEMYARDGGVMVQPGPAAQGLCGGRRPGHFAGVLTIVLKLLHLIRPEIAIFGRKDAQQCLVIAEMVRDLDVPVRLLDLPTVREPDGLAMSSRNAYLSPAGRRRARCLSDALAAARTALEAGERAPARLAAAMAAALAAADSVEYAEVRRVPDLAVPARAEGRLLLAVAARIEPARLIDNLVVQVDAGGVRETSLLDDREATA
ncbi:MAG TPA: pantoate--beta-alanine ligase [Candidatus Krumholzibacteria bacterium]|nr:pantoate--beta-alanine ligase [Candidatus Krumholzibacteria bacterium]HPD71763.1 pantoate--beta-alanine ligase [Candidatus Krumholzibacteria bacterium]HRY41304.1 pantoate--beta-alanine ligase [Candidatus Krumholzibacteria bacterium]